jgi:hypothetical protein
MITRRHFLRTTAVAGAAVTIPASSEAKVAEKLTSMTSEDAEKLARAAFLIGTMSAADREEAARFLQAELDRRKEASSCV